MYTVTYEIQEIVSELWWDLDEDSFAYGAYDEVDYEVVGTLDFQVEEEDGVPSKEEVLERIASEYGLGKHNEIKGDELYYTVFTEPKRKTSTFYHPKPVYHAVLV